MSAIEDAIAENRDAAKRFLATARGVAKEKWAQPVAPGKWSPAQIVDHIAVATEVALRAIKGDASMGSIPWILRVIPRKFGFEPTLKKGRFPEKQRAGRRVSRRRATIRLTRRQSNVSSARSSRSRCMCDHSLQRIPTRSSTHSSAAWEWPITSGSERSTWSITNDSFTDDRGYLMRAIASANNDCTSASVVVVSLL